MATNVYHYDETIHWGDDNRTTFYGWYISTSGWAESASYFRSAEQRERFLGIVRQRLPTADEYDAEIHAAIILGETMCEQHWMDEIDPLEDSYDDWVEVIEAVLENQSYHQPEEV